MRPLRNDLQVVFQDPFGSLSPRLSIKEIIGEGLEIHKQNLKKKDREKLIIDTLKKVELDTNILNRYPHEFSGGQRQRIAIARAIYKSRNILVLDEATSALDEMTEEKILKSIVNRDKNLTIIMVTHRTSTLNKCSRIFRVIDKKIIEEKRVL